MSPRLAAPDLAAAPIHASAASTAAATPARELTPTGPRAGTPSVEARLEHLADLWISEEWTRDQVVDLDVLAHPSLSVSALAEAWEVYIGAVRQRDGINDGTVHWSEIDPDITGLDPSDTAYEITCGWVADAARTLLTGRR